jgi:hypothetical protein
MCQAPVSLEIPPYVGHYFTMVSMEDLVGEEWSEWYRLTPVQRWHETEKLWHSFLTLGGSLDPEPDTQSPFFRSGGTGSMPSLWEARNAYYTAQMSLAAILILQSWRTHSK